MKMIMSIVNGGDSQRLVDALTQEGYEATIIGTTGGFLREGNATVLIGTKDEEVDGVLEIIKNRCRARTRDVTPPPAFIGASEYMISSPIEVPVGGAVVFVLDVDRVKRF